MKPRLAFIRRAYRPVAERAREMFDVAYEDRQQERRHCIRRARGSTTSTCAGASRDEFWASPVSYQCRRLRPIAIDTAAWLGSTTGRPT